MARILIVTHGTGSLRASVAAFRLAGHRVIVRETVTPGEVHRVAPDLLVIAPAAAGAVRMLMNALRADMALRLLPVIVTGAEGDLHTSLPAVIPVADTVILRAPFDSAALFDAVHFVVTTTAMTPRHVA